MSGVDTQLERPQLQDGCDHTYRFSGRGAANDRCDRPTLLACVSCYGVLESRCSASSRAKCGPCSITYRGRVRRVFVSGWTDRPTDRLYFLTLTAPSEVGGHAMPSGDVCPCTPPEGINLAEWHATAGKRWNTFITELRRKVGEVQYCKATEIQEQRGAVHFHALLRLDAKLNERFIRRLAIEHGFGHSVKLDHLGGEQGSQRAAAYCAKYASKAADERYSVAWLDLQTGEVVVGAPRLRVWTASRAWGITMKQVKLLQAKWARAVAAGAEAPASPPDGPPRPLGPLSIPVSSGSERATLEVSP